MENNIASTSDTLALSSVITSEELLKHWQGHRSLTRRVIEKYPEDKLFTYSIGGMRPFSELLMEIIGIAAPGIQGIVTGEWTELDTTDHHTDKPNPQTKEEFLQRWDEITESIDELWPQISPERFQEVDKAFGQYEAPIFGTILYFIDNEIHHRAQAYVYLRSLGIEPPAFYER